jgi:NAD(P)H-hydrate epimerase
MAFFNNTGSPALARGGSGDILTGIITALLARNTPMLEACRTAVWLHGKSGEIAAEKYGVESVLASEIIESLRVVLQKELTTD